MTDYRVLSEASKKSCALLREESRELISTAEVLAGDSRHIILVQGAGAAARVAVSDSTGTGHA
jgi:hypothetical protein